MHMSGCDMEACQVCGGKSISCGCKERDQDKYPRIPWQGESLDTIACAAFGWEVWDDEYQEWFPDVNRMIDPRRAGKRGSIERQTWDRYNEEGHYRECWHDDGTWERVD